MIKSEFQAAAILNAMRGSAMAAWDAYLALYIGDPYNAGTELTDAVAPAYLRVGPVVFAAPSGQATTNTAQVAFPTPTSDWPAVSHVAVVDGDGEIRYAGPLPGGLTLAAPTGRPVTFAPGALMLVET